jgi:hypothetical protein
VLALGAAFILNVVPYTEELWRCFSVRRGVGT